MSATAPTTPPTIAPVWLEEEEGISSSDALGRPEVVGLFEAPIALIEEADDEVDDEDSRGLEGDDIESVVAELEDAAAVSVPMHA